MKINNSKYGQGLFGLVNNGQIKNINLGENCSLNMQKSGCGGIAGTNNSYSNIYGIITNCYSLDSACKDLCGVNGYWGEVEAIIENSSLKTEQEMKSLAPTLGSAFKDDYEEESVNDGYPILSWQWKLIINN